MTSFDSNIVKLETERVRLATAAFDQAERLIGIARATGRPRDMARAVRAYEDFMRLAGLNEAQRREVLS